MTVFATFNRFARAASKRSDIVIAAFMLLAIIMMVIPLPTFLVDVLIGMNIAFSLLIFVVAFYISQPVQFSALPSIILLGTLFRLSLAITTTRLILLQADAGQIVSAFGDFVIGGEVVVGLVVFLIITIAQFVVITKGAERVAEVGARFALDAMPGKQMSIDSEARSGDIDQAEAKRKRQSLERESQFYGAMDGAMKFVKGDAVAGLIIIAINLIGGLAIGSLQHGMPFSEAAHTYSLLTVGDGLISQIPALMMAVAAGTVVTRVTSDRNEDLGTEIVGQLGANHRALALAAVILFGFGVVPGFPTVVFWTLAGLAAGLAYLVQKSGGALYDQSAHADGDTLVQIGNITKPHQALTNEGSGLMSASQRLVICLGPAIAETTSMPALREGIEKVRSDIFADIGVRVPSIAIRSDMVLEAEQFRIDFEDVPVTDGIILIDHLLVTDEPVHLDLMSIPYQVRTALIGRINSIWVASGHRQKLEDAGITFHEPVAVLMEVLLRAVRRYASDFVDVQETRYLLSQVEDEYGDLVKEAVGISSLQKISEILRRLVEEDVPIINLRVILQAVVEWGAQIQNPHALCDYARIGLARQICHRHSEMNRIVSAYLLTRETENAVRTCLQQGSGASLVNIPEEISKPIIEQLKGKFSGHDGELTRTLLTAMDIRRAIRNLLIRNDINLPVLSYQEIAPEFSVQSLGYIALPLSSQTQQIQMSGTK
ncbi:type III secretion system export apparatus subunit SctV (plasmid) [Phyllobacterium sp. A18/5-2]|uniref:type III secretion system export apparatus subunit SctV n=1 Tax=Phyllobacterium sp. A18/5-2 TaxID=2978392 RepID=UPI0021C9862B|nr:type III secretion system export apparatus subunit SctV [Phyllobacterium sp. A18/5-2]UXN66878.1 type III secretion system export apparatus subunit SctV [Phyllobacterium sp. A18/5-2]